MISKTNCQHCHQAFEYDVADLRALCPHCDQETMTRAIKVIPPAVATDVKTDKAPKPNVALVVGIIMFTIAALLRWLDWISDETFLFLLLGSVVSYFIKKLAKIERNTRKN